MFFQIGLESYMYINRVMMREKREVWRLEVLSIFFFFWSFVLGFGGYLDKEVKVVFLDFMVLQGKELDIGSSLMESWTLVLSWFRGKSLDMELGDLGIFFSYYFLIIKNYRLFIFKE